MSDQEKEKKDTISPQPDAEKTKEGTELNEEELKKVSGGSEYLKITMSNTMISS